MEHNDIIPFEKEINLSAIYNYYFRGSGKGSVQALGWANPEEQWLRFSKLCRIGIDDTPDASILDVGCGFGDFVDFLGVVIGWGYTYRGIDLRPEAIEIAKKRYPDKTFQVGSVYDEKSQFDWVVGSGIFCIDYTNWAVHTANTIEKMYELCKKGVAVNFLPTTSRDSGMLRRTTVEELQQCVIKEKKFTNYVIRYSEMDYDITLYLYKE
jgi:SAM-dependent methyltransferase